MAKKDTSTKRIAVSKANAQMVAVAAIGSFITVFCIVASNYLLGIRSYQNKIIVADNTANNNFKFNVVAEKRLVNSYAKFVNQNPTLLGTPNSNTGYKYNNATIILDALPSQYDFPAMVTSVDKILQSNNFDVVSIGGTDQSASISGNNASTDPQPVAMPFSFTINNANYLSIQALFKELQKSIRPLQIDSLTLSGTDSSMDLTVNAHTYYQPSKIFKIGTETIPE